MGRLRPPFFKHSKLVVMKSRLEIRVFAVEQAVRVLGTSSPIKDVVEKAKTIEAYVVGEANLPESYDNEGVLMGQILQGVQAIRGKDVGE